MQFNHSNNLFFKWENLEELGNLSEVIEEAEPGSEPKQVDSGAYTTFYYGMNEIFHTRMLVRGSVGTDSSRSKKRQHQQSLSKALKSLMSQKAEAKYPEGFPSGSL